MEAIIISISFQIFTCRCVYIHRWANLYYLFTIFKTDDYITPDNILTTSFTIAIHYASKSSNIVKIERTKLA